jgi:hypothetical protein
MGRVQAVLNVGQKRTDADDLRAQRECDEEKPGQYGSRAHHGILSLRKGGAGNDEWTSLTLLRGRNRMKN